LAIDNSNNINFRNLIPNSIGQTKADSPKPVKPQTTPDVKDPKDRGIDPGTLKQAPEKKPAKEPESEATVPATPDKPKQPEVSSSPTTLIQLDTPSTVPESGGFSLTQHLGLEPASSPTLVPQALVGATQGGKSLPNTPEGNAFRQTLVYAKDYDQNRVNLPFPYPGDKDGRVEQNDVGPTVAGLKHLGANDAARGVLENWLELGERYTALPGKNELAELGRSGMPKLSSALLEESKTNPDPEFLPRSYKVLADDVEQNWGDTYFKATPNGLTRFCDVDYSHDATMAESGGAKNEARFDGDPMPFNPIDLNAYLFRTEKDLQTMALGLEARATGEGDSKAAESWKQKANLWGEKAETRKKEVLGQMWDPQEGLFFDHKFKESPPTGSGVKTLAAFSVLDAGMLDAAKPNEKKILDALVGSLDKFQKPGELPVWDTKGNKPAEPADVMMVASGLEKYGHKAKADNLKTTLKAKLDSRPPSGDLSETGIRAVLSGPATNVAQTNPDQPLNMAELGSWMSPQGLEGLTRVTQGSGLQASVKAKDAGKLDRRLRTVHSSLKDPEMASQIHQKGLGELVFGVRQESGTLQPVDVNTKALGPARTAGAGEPLELGGVSFQTGLEGVEVRSPQKDVAVLTKNGHNLVLAKVEDKLVVGDRAYDLKDFPVTSDDGKPQVRLHKDILGSFHMAGDNKQLETFFDANREWVPTAERGQTSEMKAVPSRPGWKSLYDKVGDNWSELTVAPSVGPKDTAMQIFNPAAVPSLGIFKTQFNWDTLFMSKGMQLQGQQTVVDGMTDNLLYLLKSTGRVPNAARSVYLNKSQPPILPALVRMSTPVRESEQGSAFTERWLGEAYDIMGKDYNDFWNKPGEGERGVDQIDGQKTRLSRWGGPNHKFAMDESGLDTTSRYYGKTLDLVPPDLQGFLFRYANDMSEIATQLGDKAKDRGDIQGAQKFTMESARWKAEANQRKADTIKFCWDDDDGMFRDYRFQGEDQGIQKGEDSLSAAMAPLWVGMLDPSVPKEKQMIERSLDKLSRFEKDHGVASTAEDYGHPEMQWNGPSGWAPHHMIAVEAAAKYGRYEEASRITGKWLDTISRVHSRDGIILERYDVTKGDHPPVQAGRYEETQGEGPGFGWTNATLPWAMVEVIGGARIERTDNKPVFKLAPHLPKSMEGQPVALDFVNPDGQGKWDIKHQYDSGADSYALDLTGDFTETPTLEVTTPPLSAGQVPRLKGKEGEAAPAYTVQQQKTKEGKTRYTLRFEGLSGQQGLGLEFGKPPAQ
jgi:neutral trehalase